MGYMRHHAILLTTFDRDRAEEVHSKAEVIFGGNVSPIMESPTNGYYTFLIPPDGSKEGWPESTTGNQNRRMFIDFVEYLNKLRYSDRSSPIDWVEVQYGDDEHETLITEGTGEILNDSDAIIREVGYKDD